MNKRVIIGSALVLAVVVGGFLLVNRNQQKEEAVSPEITLEPSEQLTTELVPPMSEAEKQAIEDAFAKEGAEMTLLKDVSGLAGAGVGTAWRQYDGTKFYHKIDANNLTMPDKGFFYEGWLVGSSGFFSTGRLAVISGRGTLYYSTESDQTGFRGVVVTLEEEDGNPAPADHILEGSF